ncbi:Bifunctional ligase/repressor BirA [Enhygromyxa salina]|uniref:biotin--[biotin carboxyl-carrier protein] ligase n=1 Tax=Enhygromyxa salina TaxID=215803 RepID=A0A2S9YJR7_9BACT|nr:biotin--[acetyl-CoA-carboxylase] ligase [Enhygromyxa salina]PRQ05353.1 Bifunctional ligase/repressor BirA [Enhygromyxa salina]
MSRPDDALAELPALLTTVRLGRVHEHHEQIGSTNDRALEWLGAGAPDGALVTADAQTAGRGRLGRPWSSPPGRDIYASVVLRPGAPSAGFGALALAVGVGLREGLVAVFGAELSSLALKWPNDLLLGGRKLAGILCESRWRGREVELVVGFGVNVHRTREEFEPSLRARATSLALHLPEADRRGRATILAAVLHELEGTLERFFAGGFPAIRARYEPHCLVIGRAIEVEQPDGRRVYARAEGLAEDGALLARPDDGGPSFRVQSADVWLR